MTIHLHFNDKALTLAERQWFATPEAIQSLIKNAQLITSGSYNHIWRWQSPSQEAYYIKIYHRRGRYLRAYCARSRARGEWENLQYFQKKNILIPDLLVYGESTRRRHYEGGFLVQREVRDSVDLRYIARDNPRWQQDTFWRKTLGLQAIALLRQLHDGQFIHKDFKWRNILIALNQPTAIYLIDCPIGQRSPGLRYQLGWWRDLRDFDKDARLYLSRSDRLRLYLAYCQQPKLTQYDKKIIAKIHREKNQ